MVYPLDFKYISLDVTCNIKFLQVSSHFIANNYSLSAVFIMIRKDIALPTLLQPVNPTTNPILALAPTSVPPHSSGCPT